MQDSILYNEPELLKQVAVGSEAAFRRIFDAYQKRLYTYVFRVTGSREVTEDIVQDIFLQIWSMKEKLPGINNLNAYLHKSAHHAAYKSLEKLAREELVLHYLKTSNTSLSADFEEPGRRLLSKEIRQQILNLVDKLTPRQREVFLLSRNEGLKQEEIAQRLGIGFESVKSHLAAAIKFLRLELKNQHGMQATAIYVIYRLWDL